tara:strand:- start:4214 stop:4723 length:510 start_codon:yes stop_codon:yes gene_type:complete
MTLPASGPLSFQDIEDEFGASGASGIKMSDYYGEGQTLPASGTISMSDFYSQSNTVTRTVTEGADTGSYGFDGRSYATNFGSIDSNSFGSETISAAYWASGGKFTFSLLGTHTQLGMFTDITFQDGATHLPSNADAFVVFSGYTIWAWTETRPARWDGTGTSTVIITPP